MKNQILKSAIKLVVFLIVSLKQACVNLYNYWFGKTETQQFAEWYWRSSIPFRFPQIIEEMEYYGVTEDQLYPPPSRLEECKLKICQIFVPILIHTKNQDTLQAWQVIETLVKTMAMDLEFKDDSTPWHYRRLEDEDMDTLWMRADMALTRKAGVIIQHQNEHTPLGDKIAKKERITFMEMHARFLRFGLVEKVIWNTYFDQANQFMGMGNKVAQD